MSSTRFYALKSAEFESRYLQLPVPVMVASDPIAYKMICREMLGACIQRCSLSNFMSTVRFNLAVRFETGRGVDPDIERTNAGCYMLASLFPAPATGLPWWLSGAADIADDTMLTGPDALRAVVDRLHELKLVEVILANVAFGEAAPHIISFCRFLEDNADRNAWLLAIEAEDLPS